MEGSNATGLKEILKGIRAAAEDEHIKGIMLDVSYSPNSYATLEEIRNALQEFKKSKKFVVAYGEMMEEHSYYLASVADKIYMHPTGDMLFNGFSYSSVYMKGLLDKLGVEAQLIRHGKFKAAGEPLIADHMSDENREQIKSFTGSIFNHFIEEIAKSRKKTTAEVLEISNKLQVQSLEDAKKLGLIDGLKYRDEFDAELRKLAGTEEGKELDYMAMGSYAAHAREKNLTVKNKIAVIYASGDIVSGESDKENMGSETIVEALKKARKDSAVKAVVLRVNSPGGSALASDVIWREVILTKKVKPVVVSMGAVAASGGYYIAAPADMIIAEPNTITGSIGVFGLTINAQKLLNDKLGLRFEKVNFGDYADIGSPDRPMTAPEKEIIQRMIDRIYDDFISRVAEGRKLTKEHVDSIAQGRVWSGADAIKIGLVDELGGIEKAIAVAAKKAKLEEYRVTTLPEQKDPIDQLLKTLTSDASAYMVKKELGENYQYYMSLQKALKYQGIQARMMWDGEIQ
jgi:protease-4